MTNPNTPKPLPIPPTGDPDAVEPDEHGPGGMDNIDEDEVHGEDEDAPGGMSGIPEESSRDPSTRG